MLLSLIASHPRASHPRASAPSSTASTTVVDIVSLSQARAHQPRGQWFCAVLLTSTLLSALFNLSLQPPTPSRSTAFSLGSTVQAQSDDLIARYARAAFDMEQSRRRDYAEVKRIMGGNVPEDVCDRGNLPTQVQNICGRFTGRLDGILAKYGLSRSDFNSVHRRSNDPSVQQRIQQELIRLQTR